MHEAKKVVYINEHFVHKSQIRCNINLLKIYCPLPVLFVVINSYFDGLCVHVLRSNRPVSDRP